MSTNTENDETTDGYVVMDPEYDAISPTLESDEAVDEWLEENDFGILPEGYTVETVEVDQE